jgi:hypothetical protein
LISVAKGAMLASSIFRDNPVPLDDRFDNTDLYLDTPVIFRALGFFGPAAQRAQFATISGATSFGAGVKCFEETMAEVKSVILAVADKIAGVNFSPDEKSIGLYFLKQGFSAEEVRSVATRVERDLVRAGVAIVPRPSHINKLTVDEVDLAAVIQGERPNYGKHALDHDVDALTAVFRIRRGRAANRLERSRATFISTNPRVIAGSDEFEDFKKELFPLAIFEDRAATLIWIKTPMAYPDLPRDQIVARVAALLAPTQQVWSKYIEQVARLRKRDTIDASDEILLRQHYEVDRLLVTETLNDPDVVSEESVTTVLEKVKADIKRPLVAETNDLKAIHAIKEQYLESQAQLAQQESDALVRRLRQKSHRISVAISSTLYWTLVAAIAALLTLSLIFKWPVVSQIVQALLLVGLAFGSLLAPIKWVREKARESVERVVTRVFEVEPASTPRVRADEDGEPSNSN